MDQVRKETIRLHALHIASVLVERSTDIDGTFYDDPSEEEELNRQLKKIAAELQRRAAEWNGL